MTRTGKDRFAAALRGEQVDPPAFGLTFLPLSAASDRRGVDGVVSALPRAISDGDFDFVFVPSWEPNAELLMRVARDAGAAALWTVRGALWPALDEMGLGEGLRATLLDPASLRGPLDAAVEDARCAVTRGASLGADAIVVAEDLAGRDGPLVTLEYAVAELMPRLGTIASAIAAAGLPAVIHSDGGVGGLCADMREAGFEALHAGGMSGEDFEDLLTRARSVGLVVIGGIMTASLAEGLPAAVMAGTRAGILARRGGLILADDGGVTGFDQYAALLAAFAAARGA
jgi:hypothetical protein